MELNLRWAMNKNILMQLRKKGLTINFVSVSGEFKKIKVTPHHLIKGETLYWLQTRKKEIAHLLKKEIKLKALIEQVAKQSNYSEDNQEQEIEELFQETLENYSLDDAIASFQLTRDRQAKLIPEHYTKSVSCRCCGDVKLWEQCPEVILGCPMCLERLSE